MERPGLSRICWSLLSNHQFPIHLFNCCLSCTYGSTRFECWLRELSLAIRLESNVGFRIINLRCFHDTHSQWSLFTTGQTSTSHGWTKTLRVCWRFGTSKVYLVLFEVIRTGSYIRLFCGIRPWNIQFVWFYDGRFLARSTCTVTIAWCHKVISFDDWRFASLFLTSSNYACNFWRNLRGDAMTWSLNNSSVIFVNWPCWTTSLLGYNRCRSLVLFVFDWWLW